MHGNRKPFAIFMAISMAQDNLEFHSSKNITFESIRYANDDMFSVIFEFYAKKIYASEEIIYYVSRSAGNLTMHMDRDTLDIRAQEKIREY